MATKQQIDGVSLAAVLAGSIFAWAGIKGYSIPETVQNVIQGKPPKGTVDYPIQASGATDTSGAPVPTGGGSSSQNEALAKAMAGQRGWTGAQWTALQALWTQESGFRTNATNPSSGAFGIPQSLPASKMASAGADWKTNPATQIKWGLGYIASTYGDPVTAEAHEKAVGWY